MPNFFEASLIGNLGIPAGLGTNALSIGIGTNQQFRTIPIANTRLSLYSLTIRSGQGFGLVGGYTFPLSPANIRKEFNAMTGFYDVAGTPDTFGVQRIIDLYGNSPVIYIIEGTTGWKLHSTDGYSLTGLDSIRALESTLNQFAYLTQTAISGQSGQDLYVLEFYDYFREDFWQVVPLGPQIVRQSRTRPLFVDYMFRLLGVQDLSQPINIIDPLAGAFSASPGQASFDATNFGSDVSNNYGDVTIDQLDISPAQ